jgi:hypothetical protein
MRNMSILVDGSRVIGQCGLSCEGAVSKHEVSLIRAQFEGALWAGCL